MYLNLYNNPSLKRKRELAGEDTVEEVAVMRMNSHAEVIRESTFWT